MRRLCVIVVYSLISFLTAKAGILTPGLTSTYAAHAASDRVPALIALSEESSAAVLSEEWSAQGLVLSDIHSRLMETLKTRASERQAGVLKSLAILQTTGMAANIRTFWIANVIAADLTKAAAELTANMPDVEAVGLDESAVLNSMQISEAVSTARDWESSGVRDAWAAGFYGEGRTVCVIGDGAAVHHPALSGTWRGRLAPASECWFDKLGQAPSVCGNQSAAAISLICGIDAVRRDTIGFAPAANWIAARVFCATTRVSDVLAAVQWAADPDGNSATIGDIPDAVLNMWNVESSCTEMAPAGVWKAFDNVEALGPVMVFAVRQVRNAGSASIRAPESLSAGLAVGNVEIGETGAEIQSASTRGPSPCDASIVKPDIVACGTAMPAVSDKGIISVTGTAAAAARVASSVLLLRQSNPLLTAAELKQILRVTASDLGGFGPDPVYGNGLLHVERARLTAATGSRTGTVQGMIRCGTEMIPGARVVLSAAGGDLLTTTRDGSFLFEHVAADRSYALYVGRFGYKLYLQTDSVYVETGRTSSVIVDLERGFEDGAEFDQGWSLGVEGDNATGGNWVRAVPVGSRADGKPVQPDADASVSGQMCFVTGNASSASADASGADVDGGSTTLRSPLFSLLGMENPAVHFAYWFSNDKGSNPRSDFFRVQISADGGYSWVNLINTSATTNGWQRVNLPLSGFITLTDRMMLQFVAEDAGPGSLVEAAVDEISISGTTTPAAAETLEAPRDLTLDVQPDHVRLIWKPSPGASSYRVYLSGSPDRVVVPENLYTTTGDTILIVPMSDIRFNEFYFQITAQK